MYLRFITQFINKDGQIETGLFQALGFIRDDYQLTHDDDERKLSVLSAWFKDNLIIPEVLTNKNTHHNIGKYHEFNLLSWFKDSAKEHIIKVNEIIEILDKYDLIVERVTCKYPGIIVYQDEFQVCAHPLKSEKKRVL